MRLVSPTRRAALVAAAVTAAAGAAIAFSPLGDSPAAAGTPPHRTVSVSVRGPDRHPTRRSARPRPDRHRPQASLERRKRPYRLQGRGHDGVALPPRPGLGPGRLRSGHPPARRPRPMPVPGRPRRARLLRGPGRRPRRREPPTGPGRPLCHLRPPTEGRARGECADPGALPLSVAEATNQRTDDLVSTGVIRSRGRCERLDAFPSTCHAGRACTGSVSMQAVDFAPCNGHRLTRAPPVLTPYPWSVVPYLPGVPAAEASSFDPAGAAAAVGRFLGALHVPARRTRGPTRSAASRWPSAPATSRPTSPCSPAKPARIKPNGTRCSACGTRRSRPPGYDGPPVWHWYGQKGCAPCVPWRTSWPCSTRAGFSGPDRLLLHPPRASCRLLPRPCRGREFQELIEN